MTQIKVLHTYRTYFPDPPGGLQEAIRQIALSTSHFNVESRIFTLSPTPTPEEFVRPEGKVVRSRSHIAPSSCDLGGFEAFQNFSQQARWADVLHYHFPWPFADLLHFGKRVKKPAIMTYHSDVINKGILGSLYTPLMLKMIASMDAVVSTSKAYANSSPVLKKYVAQERLHIIPLGIDEGSYSDFTEKAEHIDLDNRFNVEKGRYFLFVGVLRSYKGLKILVQAAAKSKLPVVIAGSGPEHDSLSRLAQGKDNIRLIGQVSNAEKIALLKGCRAAVLPSNFRSEAFGVFLIEAAMCGKPMISCEIATGTSYVNKHQESGFVVPPNDIGALAQAMQDIWNNNDLTQNLGLAARRRYDRLFSDKIQGDQYGRLYKALIS